jgi:hypothetical protein
MPLADDLRPEPQKQVGFPCLLEKPIIVYHTHTQIYIYILASQNWGTQNRPKLDHLRIETNYFGIPLFD